MIPKLKVIKFFAENWSVTFTIGVQSFFVHAGESKEKAEWYKKQLITAFKELEHITKSKL